MVWLIINKHIYCLYNMSNNNTNNMLTNLVKSVDEMRALMAVMYDKLQKLESAWDDRFPPVNILLDSDGKYSLNNKQNQKVG